MFIFHELRDLTTFGWLAIAAGVGIGFLVVTASVIYDATKRSRRKRRTRGTCANCAYTFERHKIQYFNCGRMVSTELFCSRKNQYTNSGDVCRHWRNRKETPNND